MVFSAWRSIIFNFTFSMKCLVCDGPFLFVLNTGVPLISRAFVNLYPCCSVFFLFDLFVRRSQFEILQTLSQSAFWVYLVRRHVRTAMTSSVVRARRRRPTIAEVSKIKTSRALRQACNLFLFST